LSWSKASLVLSFLSIILGCSPSSSGEERKGISGFVVEIRPDTQQVLVAENDNTASDNRYDAVIYSVDNHTSIFDRKGNALIFSDITLGQEVDVWANTPDAESYPASAGASKIIVREDLSFPTSKITRSQAIHLALEEFSKNKTKGKIVKNTTFVENTWVISIMNYKGDVNQEIIIDANTGQVKETRG
jgi:hypothetical protein